jgi:hypothetical protein
MRDSGMLLVICLTVLIGLGVPAMLVAGLRRGGSVRQSDLLRRAGKTAANPWSKEDADLAELGRLADKLRKK